MDLGVSISIIVVWALGLFNVVLSIKLYFKFKDMHEEYVKMRNEVKRCRQRVRERQALLMSAGCSSESED